MPHTRRKQLKIEYMPLDEIIRWPRNAKLHMEEEIAGSIERFAFNTPIEVNTHPKANFLLAGHGRLKALVRLKEEGKPAPRHIGTDNGTWLVPVVKLRLPPKEAVT